MTAHTPARITAATVQRLARLGGLKPLDRIVVAGPGAGDALCALCRLGFDEATGLGGAAPGGCEGRQAAALLVPDRLTDLALAARLASAARWLGDSAMVLVRLRDLDQDRVVQAALEEGGLVLGSAVFDLSRGALAAHGVTRRASRRAMATGQLAKAA